MPLGQCIPCLDHHEERAAAVLIDGVPQCMRCVRGDGAVRPMFAEAPNVLPLTPEPRLQRKADVLPQHLTPSELLELMPPTKPVVREPIRMVPTRPIVLAPAKPTTTAGPQIVPLPPKAVPADDFLTENVNAPFVTFLLEELAKALGMRMSDYTCKTKTRPYVTLRQMASWLLRKHTRCSLPAVGRRMGFQHHTTVRHSALCIEARMQADRGMARMLEQVWQSANERLAQQKASVRVHQISFTGTQQSVIPAVLAGLRQMTEMLQAGAA